MTVDFPDRRRAGPLIKPACQAGDESGKPTSGPPMPRPGPHDALRATAARCGAITIGIDGRLYCHDLTPDLVTVLLELCPGNKDLLARQVTVKQELPHA